MNRIRLLLLVIFMLVVAALSSSKSGSLEASLLQTNTLQNPSFEEPYSNGVAQGWAPQHSERNSNPKPADCSEDYAVKPKWNPELATSSLIYDGGRSQIIGNQFDTWDAVVMQTVPATPGSTYRFSFYATGRASNDQYPAPSDTSVNLRVQAGIDPVGRGNYVAHVNEIAWGPSGSPHMGGSAGNWQQFSVEATASANQITVFARANLGGANQCRAHLDVWFDKAELVTAGPPPTNTSAPPPTSPPQPVATNTPVPPTATATSEVPPTETAPPTPEPTNTPLPPQGGVICVNAFADDNANGLREEGEGFMAGVTFSVILDNQVIAQGVSTGTSSAVCFNQDPGIYTVAQTVPRTLEMTTAPEATIEVFEGSTTSLEFGSRIKDDFAGEIEPTSPVQTPTGSEGSDSGDSGDSGGDEGPSTLAIVGLGAIFVAILMLGFLIFLLLRQQRAS